MVLSVDEIKSNNSNIAIWRERKTRLLSENQSALWAGVGAWTWTNALTTVLSLLPRPTQYSDFIGCRKTLSVAKFSFAPSMMTVLHVPSCCIIIIPLVISSDC